MVSENDSSSDDESNAVMPEPTQPVQPVQPVQSALYSQPNPPPMSISSIVATERAMSEQDAKENLRSTTQQDLRLDGDNLVRVPLREVDA